MECSKVNPEKSRIEEWLSRNSWELATMGVLIVLMFSQFAYFFERTIYGHDDLSQICSYTWNLSTEGRWINWLFFPVLHYVNTKVVLVVDYVLLGFFGYCCAKIWLQPMQSIIAAIVVMLLPSTTLFFDWPIIAFPAFFFLAIAAIVYSKMPLWCFFTLFGILFNATYSNMYFLLPLLFFKADVQELWKMVVYWILGYLVGFAIAETITFIVCGHFIELADFRKANYIDSWNDIKLNFFSCVESLNAHLRYMGKIGIVLVFPAISMFCYSYRNEKMRGLTIGCILVLVALSCYAQAFPAGILVSLRTVHALYLAILIGLVVSVRRCRFVFLGIMLLWGGRCFWMNAQNLEWQNVQRNAFFAGIEAMSLSPETLDGVVILISDKDVKSVANKIENRMGIACYSTGMGMYYMHPVLRKAGFKRLHYAVHSSDFMKEIGVNPEALSFVRKGIYEYSISKNYLWLRLASVNDNE